MLVVLGFKTHCSSPTTGPLEHKYGPTCQKLRAPYSADCRVTRGIFYVGLLILFIIILFINFIIKTPPTAIQLNRIISDRCSDDITDDVHFKHVHICVAVCCRPATRTMPTDRVNGTPLTRWAELIPILYCFWMMFFSLYLFFFCFLYPELLPLCASDEFEFWVQLIKLGNTGSIRPCVLSILLSKLPVNVGLNYKLARAASLLQTRTSLLQFDWFWLYIVRYMFCAACHLNWLTLSCQQ